MTEDSKPYNTENKRRRWPWLVLLGILFFMAAVRLSLKTDFVRDIVKNQVVANANEQLTVDFSIRDLKGDLWKEAILHGVAITENETDTLASIDSVNVNYKLLSYLQPVFEISEATISKPFLKLRQQDEDINLAAWVKPVPKSDEASEPFPVRVDRFDVHKGSIDAMLQALERDSAFVIDNLELSSSFALLQDGYEANISNLSFDILQTRLDETVSFKSKLQADKQTVSLEKVVLATGNSILQSSGTFNTGDTTASINLESRPLSWRDIAAYVDQSPVQQNMELDLSIQGSLKQFQMALGIGAESIEDLKLGAEFRWDSTLTLTKAEVTAKRLSLSDFSNDAGMPDLRNLKFEAAGEVPVQDYESSSLKGTLSFSDSRYDLYKLDEFNSTFSIDGGIVQADFSVLRQRQNAEANLTIKNVWSSLPDIRLNAEGRNINPGYWLQDEKYGGNLAFSANLNGKGLVPGDANWNYSIKFGQGSIAQQRFTGLTLQGIVNRSTITNETQLELGESKLSLSASLKNYRDKPKFSYNLNSKNLDLSELRDMESFPTSLFFTVSGEGSGSSLVTLEMQSAIRMDSSIVNGERIESLTADIAIKDTVATISSAELQSSIAEGSFDARLHLERWYDTSNMLNLDLVLKDLQTFAFLADVEELNAEGTVKGDLVPVSNEKLKFTGEVDLKNLVYNEQFNAETAIGKVEVFVKQEPEFTVDLDLVSPTFSTVQLQDLLVQTRGKVSDSKVEGRFSLNFIGTNENEIIHAGSYNFAADSSVVTTDSYDIKSSLRTLSLQQPFSVVIKDQALRMDTMKVASDDGAALELAIPYADSVRQKGYLVGKNLNMTLIQNTLLSESYFEGMLSGNISVANSDTGFTASGRMSFSEINYQGTALDSLSLVLDIGSDQLKGSLSAIDQGDEIITGALDLPFRIGNPRDFDEAFFERPVEGSFRFKRVALNRFDNLLTRMGILNTEGMLQLKADLKGTAGEPQLTGDMILDSAMISGVQVDTLSASMQYIHESSSLSLKATVNSLKQRAAEINAEVPFYVDLKAGELSLPGKEDSISVDIETSNFNLAALNDFVNRDQVRNIQGRVDGMVHITGPLDALDTKGQLNFTESSVRIVQTGITVDGINASILFEPDLVTLKNFKAQSGSGSLNMNGSMSFREMVPGDINATLKARNFRVANTSQHNAVIDLDSKISGTVTQPNIKGSLSVLSGFVQLDNFGEESVEAVQLDPSEEPDKETAIYDSLALDLDVSFNRRFFLRNQRYLEMEVELDGSVDMVKNAGEDLQMFGSLETAGGYARPLGKRFELEEGGVTFTGDATNPDLNIRTLFEPPRPEEDIMIWYTIGGSVEDPTFKYESSPPMELEDILCYTLFSQPCYALDSWKRAVASSGSNAGATGLALGLLGDRIESLATQSLGIDVVRIENTRVGGNTGTSITTGWYINPKTFFAIQNVITGSTPDTSFLLEYMLLENLKLIISQGTESGQGLDLRWNYDY